MAKDLDIRIEEAHERVLRIIVNGYQLIKSKI